MNFFQRAMPIVVIAAAVLFVGGTIWGLANEKALFTRLVPEREATIGRHFVDLLLAKNYAAIDASIDAQYRGPKALRDLARTGSALPPSVDHIDVVGYHWEKSTADPGTIHQLVYELTGTNAWSYVAVDFNENAGAIDLTGLQAQRLADSLEHANAFTLSGKNVIQYAFLCLVIALGGFVIATFVICYRSPDIKNRWLWMVFILFGFFQASMNWTTGETSIIPITIHTPPVFVFSDGLYTPWILGFTIPIGAIIFWLRRKAITTPTATPIETPQVSEIAPA